MARKKKAAEPVRSGPQFPTPQSRNEAILQNILGASNTLPTAQSRIEEILQAILDNDPSAYEAAGQSRIEDLLLCILNSESTDIDTPESPNEEILLAKINGETYDKDTQSRIEALLKQWCNGSGE